MRQTRLLVPCLAALALCAAAQTENKAETITAQGYGPVMMAAGDRLEVCLGNLGEGNAVSTVQIFAMEKDTVRPVSKHDSSLGSGKSACYQHTAKTAHNVFVVLAGDPKGGWDISDRNLMTSAQVIDSKTGKPTVVLPPVPKVVTTALLQK